MSLLAFADADQGADDSDFISRVVEPWDLAAVLAAKPIKVGLEHLMHRLRRQSVGKVELGDSVGRGGRIKVRPLDRAGDIVELALGDYLVDGVQDIMEKCLRFLAPAIGFFGVAYLLGDICSGLKPADAPEIIPIGMDRMSEVAFVAGGFWQ